MLARKFGIVCVVIALAAFNASTSEKPLKIFIMAGQSNMQGQAQVRTIERLNLSEDSKQMYQDMKVKSGLPSAVEGVYGVYFTGGDKKKGKDRPLEVNKGPFRPGYGDKITGGTTLGPDYTFGIYMQKNVQGPILIIKTAWGGRDLTQQFRPPSAAKYGADFDGHGNPTGYYYKLMMECVKKVLADPGAYYPGYNKAAGCEIAGFVWVHGFNDLIKSPSVYPDYTHALTCLINDVRKDLNAPKMPFVIGVMGIGGPNVDRKQSNFRKAQEAPAYLPEFAGNVAAVRTELCWDMEWEKIKAKPKDTWTQNEQKIMQTATSNEEFHYNGSAYIYGNIGKVLAEAMVKLMK